VAATLEVITPGSLSDKAFAAGAARTKDGAVVQALLDIRSDGSSRRKGDRKP
jgi:hypothetical protein